MSTNIILPVSPAILPEVSKNNPLLQEAIEQSIIQYQHARTRNNQRAINAAFEDVCRLYDPLRFVHTWHRRYRHLYDTREDFVQDYLRVFCTSLSSWKPREERGESRYGGSGKFANFFWSALSNNYINMVKAAASGKRNQESRCPICETWCAPLATHLRLKHEDLLWEQMEIMGLPICSLTGCPFCKSHKTPRTIACKHQETRACAACLSAAQDSALKRHLLSMHSAFLFERFRELHPEYSTLPCKPLSVEGENDGEPCDLYDIVPDTSKIGNLLASDLSPLQQQIISECLSAGGSPVYKPSLYNCPEDVFDAALDDLKTKMTLVGLE